MRIPCFGLRVRAAGVFAGLIVASVFVSPANATSSALPEMFANPPREYAPKLWWRWREHFDEQFPLKQEKTPWIYAKIDEALVTKELEEYAAGGLYGTQWGPRYPERPRLDRLFGHAARESARLGMVIDIHTEPGNAGTAGEWNKAEHSMQFLTWSLTRAEGGRPFPGTLPRPPANSAVAHNATDTEMKGQVFYRDVAVVAFPDPDPAEPLPAPTVTATGVSDEDLAALRDGKRNRYVRTAAKDGPVVLTFDYGAPQKLRAFSLTMIGYACGEVLVSDDGENFRPVRTYAKVGKSLDERYLSEIAPWTIPFEAPPARYFRLVIGQNTKTTARNASFQLAEVEGLSGARVDRLGEQALYIHAFEVVSHRSLAADAPYAVDPATVIDLTGKMKPDGTLDWQPPAGRWQILRLGRTTTGIGVPYMTHDSLRKGFQADKLSREAMDHHFKHWLDPLLEAAGPEGRKGINALWVDSWEINSQNWTPKMPEAFKAYAGYELWRYYPAFAGFLMRDRDHTEKFWWDWRRNIAEMVADNYFGYITEIARRHGLKYEAQIYGNQQGDIWDVIQVGGRVDVVQDETWSSTRRGDARITGVPSAANIHGRGILVGGEHLSEWFGGQRPIPPAQMKAAADFHFARGVNQLTYGTFNPASLDAEWSKYLARCQVLLRRGLIVRDIAYLYGEGAPLRPDTRKLQPPAGYQFDYYSAEAFLSPGTRVENGELVAPSGARYRLLMLPPDDRLTPALLKRLKTFVEAGLPVAGMKPVGAPAFRNDANADAESRALADALWGDGDQLVRTVGKGRVYSAYNVAKVLAEREAGIESAKDRVIDVDRKRLLDAEKIAPDVVAPVTVAWIHRRDTSAGRDTYFLAHEGAPTTAEIQLRTAGKTPRLWDPQTGKITDCTVVSTSDGLTTIRIEFVQNGSAFVVFE